MLECLCLLAVALPQEAAPLSSTLRELPRLGITLRDERRLDPETTRIVRITTDIRDGSIVDADALIRREHELELAASGKLSLDLVRELATREPTERVTVVVWLEPQKDAPSLRVELERARERGMPAEDARRFAMQLAAQSTAPRTAAFAAQMRALGHEVVHADAYVPIVFVTLRKSDVAALGKLDGVDLVYWSFPTWMAEEGSIATPNEWASPSARTDVVHRRGINGSGVKVLMNDVGAVSRTNSNLPTIVVGPSSVSVQAHATAVAGMIASHHPIQHGAAPGLTSLYDYGGASDTSAPLAWTWGMQQGISFGNCSWWNGNRGSIAFLDRYFDYIIRNFAVQLFKSAGNQGNGQACTTPGNGFNSIASGNADDRNTHDWGDDVLSSSSSTGNPQPQGHEKPEVTAHGTTITSTNTSGGVSAQGTGTSYASPVSCGTAALLAQTDAALLAAPEAVKALLMAGAWNDIVGGQPLSDYDGAGGIDAAASQSALANGQLLRTTLTSASFPGGVFAHTIHLDANDETRVCANWSALANSSYSSTVLEMDLDLIVRAPGGAVVASSASSANPFEIVQFVPPASGDYRVELQRMRFVGTSEPLAIAWTTSWDARTCAVAITGTPRLGATIGLQWSDRYHPGQPYVGFLSITPYPATWQVPTNKLLHLGFDGLASASILLPGFIGVLPGNGAATASLTIPNLPGLENTTIHASMLTLQGAAPLAAELGEVASFTILP